jgi:methyl-accepting chemotaxis protein
MVFSALFIQQSHGMVEMHFSIFALLAFLIAYADWRPVVAGAVVIALHHVGFFFAQAVGAPVFVLPRADAFAVIVLHALFVVAETAVLVYLAARLKSLFMEGEHASAFAARVKAGRLDYTFDRTGTDRSPTTAALADLQGVLRADLLSFQGSAQDTAESAAVAREAADGAMAALQRQAAATEEVAASVEELSASFTITADSARATHEKALVGGELSGQAAGQVKALAAETAGLAQDAAQAAALVAELETRSRAVTGVVAVIRGISEQTNLLALNAAIEAARAGESGRGFSVVADEVRKLAESTQAEAQKITGLIEQMREAQNCVLRTVEQSAAKARQGEQVAIGAAASMDKVHDGAQLSVQLVGDISKALAEQKAAVESIASALERLAAEGQESGSRSAAVASSMDRLISLSADLKDKTGRFKL